MIMLLGVGIVMQIARLTTVLCLAVACVAEAQSASKNAPAKNPDERSASEKVSDFVRAAHDDRVSIFAFAGTLISPAPPRQPQRPCISKVMPSFRAEFDVEQVLVGNSVAHVRVVFEGCGFPSGADYSTGDHLLVFAVVVNGGEFVGRLLLPADQKTEAKAALDAALKKSTRP
jgi:Na+-transporting methylmalonyl-CoA/oxaloacetate decarboxylase gamma subunit